MKHIKDIEYNEHEIVILQNNISGLYAVDIRADAYAGAYIAGYDSFDTADDAERAGKIYVNGYIDGQRGYKGDN
jgi:hypothetical protein